MLCKEVSITLTARETEAQRSEVICRKKQQEATGSTRIRYSEASFDILRVRAHCFSNLTKLSKLLLKS